MNRSVWPAADAFISLKDVPQISDGAVCCTAVAICDEQLQPVHTFYQGQKAHFFYEFEILQPIAAVAGGLEIIDSNGQVLHGKNSFQYQLDVPKKVRAGQRVRFHHIISLDLGANEYAFSVTLSSVDAEQYAGYRKGTIAESVFRPQIREHCRVKRVSTLTVGYHPFNKLLHHGVTNLPGTISAKFDTTQSADANTHVWYKSARHLKRLWRGSVEQHPTVQVTTPQIHAPFQAAVLPVATSPTVFHITHWKAGSQWIRQILEYCSPDLIVEPQVGEAQFLHHPLQPGKIYPTVYVTKQQYDGVAKPTNSRRFVVLRDLRDTLISGYFSLKVSHPLQTWEHDYQRLALQSMNQEDGLIYLMDEWLPGCARIQLSWLEAEEPVILYRDLLDHDLEIFERVLIDECELDVSRDTVRAAVLANRFKQMAGGRERGKENINVHLRKGIDGDWRNYFTERVTRAFKLRYGSLLIASGYEQDLNW